MTQHTPMTRHGRKEKIRSIHILRGITIVAIVFRHSLFLFDSRSMETSLFARIVDEFFFNWTILFVLISGYLFQYLAYKYETRRYWKSKLKNVIAPYVAVSLASFGVLHGETVRALPLFSAGTENLLGWGFRMLLTGQHSAPMWYIPMISVIFLMGPLLYRLSFRDLIVPAVICLLWTLMSYKPDPWNVPLNVLHFLPVYIFGMFLCQRHEEILRLVRENIALICVFFLVIMGVSFHEKFELFLLNQSGSYLMSIEKIVLFLILLSCLERRRLPERLEKVFSYLADISFAVYLTHMIVLHTLRALCATFSWWPAVTGWESGALSTLMNALFAACILLLCAAMTELVRRALPRKSRLVIGA